MAVALPTYSQTVGTSTSCVIDIPSGTANGDLMTAFLVSMETATTWSEPGGWTLVQDSGYVATFSKVASSEGANYTFTASNTGQFIGSIMRITGGTTIGASSKQSNAASTTATGATITPPSADSLLLFMVYGRSTVAADTSNYAIVTSNPTWTELFDVVGDSSRPHASLAYANRPETTATGDATATLNTSVANIVHFLSVSPGVPASSAKSATTLLMGV